MASINVTMRRVVGSPSRRSLVEVAFLDRTIGILSIFGLALSGSAFAQGTSSTSASQTSQTTLNSAQAKPAAPKIFGLRLYADLSSNLKPINDPDHSMGSKFDISPSVKLSQDFTLSALLEFTRVWRDFEETKLFTNKLGVSYSAIKSDLTKLTLRSSLGFPLTTDQRDRESFMFSISSGMKYVQSLDSIGLKGFSTLYDVSVKRSFHQFETSTNGTQNYPYSLLQDFGLSYDFSDKISLGSTYEWFNLWSYKGNNSQRFSWSQELSYQATPVVGLAVGISNGGAIQKDNGRDSNISVFDENVTEVYSSLTLVF